MGKMLKLRDELHEGLAFGPDRDPGPGLIQFGLRGGFPPGIAYVDEDHPLLAQLFELEPHVTIVTDDGLPSQVFMCPDHPDREFRTKNALLTHLRSKNHGPVGVEELEPANA